MKFTEWIRGLEHACVSDAINNQRKSKVLPWKTPRPPRDIDVLAIRKACERFGYGQSTFAGMLGVSVRTLQGWEQKRRKPTGPARALLLTIHHNPMAYFDAIAAWNAQ
jgi:putative transcriptional regulator